MRSASASGSAVRSACAVVNMPGGRTALQGVMLAEAVCSGLQRFVARQALDGDDAGPSSLHRQHQTGADRGAVDDDRARTAGAMLTAEMGSGQAHSSSAAYAASRKPCSHAGATLRTISGW